MLEGEELISGERQLLARRDRPATEEQPRSIVQNTMLLRRPDVIITPHIAFDSREALERILDTTAANVAGFIRGEPQNLVRA